MLHYLELLYFWLLAPLGLYMLVKPPVRMLLCWLSLRSCIKTANEMNIRVTCGAPPLRSMLVYAMHPVPAKRGPTYAWYGFGNWQAWEAAAESEQAAGPVYTRTDDSVFDRSTARFGSTEWGREGRVNGALLLAHVDGGRVDDFLLIETTGDDHQDQNALHEARERFCGRPYRLWLDQVTHRVTHRVTHLGGET